MEVHVDKVQIDRTMLDGRLAERHTSFTKDGDKVVEIFVEEKRPLQLEKRIIQKHKMVVAEERTEHIKDGEIQEVEVKAIDAPSQMQVREHIGVADHAKIVDGGYVTKTELVPIVTEAVIAGMASLFENMEIDHVSDEDKIEPMALNSERQIAERVTAENKEGGNDTSINMILVALIMAQLAFGFWIYFM